ncbi:MAG: hypothetical protein ACFFBP_18695 [Promethearchaeota archaeon]
MLGPNEFIEGLFSLLYVIANMIIGILVILRYFKYKDKTFIFVGLTLLGAGCPWWPSSVSFLSNVILNQPLPDQIYFFLGNAFAPILTYAWIIALNILLFEGKNKILLVVYAVILGVFQVGFLLMLFFTPHSIGELDRYHLNVQYFGFVMTFLILILMTITLTGIWVSVRSMKSDNPLVKLKGQILFLSYTTYAILAILDAVVPLITIGVIIVRIFLILNFITIYMGWVMPEPAQKFFIKIKLLKEL